ncbi:MAG: ATP-binding protein, partial [Chloroflexota bacterium]
MTEASAAPPPVRSGAAQGDERAYYNISQAAALLGVSRVSIWRWIRDGDLEAARLGHRTTRIKREDLEGFLRRVGSGPTGAHRGRSRSRTVPAESASPNWDDLDARGHVVQFYERDAFLIDAVAEFVGNGLRSGDAGIVVATPAHRAALEEHPRAGGLDLVAARARGAYASLDASELLSTFMVNGAPDGARFFQVLGELVARAAEGGRRVRIFGEMVALLARDGNHAETIHLEELWNQLRQTCSFSLFCAYPIDCLRGEALADLLDGVCGQHARVIPTESYTALPTPDERLRAITALQQKAESLAAEVAQRREAEDRLRSALFSERAARHEAQAALRLRDEFLSIAAHELKTPITSLSGHMQLALRKLTRGGQADPELAIQALGMVSGQVGKLTRLVNQLFDVSQVEAGKLAISPEPTDLVSLVGQAVANACLTTDRHVILVTSSPSLHGFVDAPRLEQVLTNLLDNAIKYSPEGGDVEVALHSESSQAELSVRDHGLGIPPEKRERIFDRFYQAHDGSHRGGMGLGLHVSRQIVELHGGEIRAEFPPDGGTRLVVRLPLKASSRNHSATASETKEASLELRPSGHST